MRLSTSLVLVAVSAFIVACGDDPNNLKGGAGAGTTTTVESPAPATDEQAPPPPPAGTTPTPAPTTPPATPPVTPPDTTAEQVCVDAINGYRATLGLAPYARWTSGETCADGQATSDAASKKAHGAFGTCKEFAQNECPGWPGPADKMVPGCLKMMWAEGPGGGHYENMRSTRYTQVSCGFSTLPDGSVWAVQNFK